MNTRSAVAGKLAAVAALLLASVASSLAASSEIAEIQQAIHAKGGRWVAEENALSRLPLEAKVKWLGALSGGLEPAKTLPAPDAATAASTTGSFDWRNVGGRNYVTPVKSQGSCGSCWAFSTTAQLESYLLLRDPSIAVPNNAEQILLSCSGAGSCGGGWPGSASAYIVKTGLPPESYFPYTGTNNLCSNALTGWQNVAAKIGSYAGVNQEVEALKNALGTYGPLSTTFNVYNDFYSYRSGVYSYTTGGFVGRHAVLIVGYDDAQQYFIVKNSWGSGWGEQGYFRVAYSEVNSSMGFGAQTYAYMPPSTTPLVANASVTGYLVKPFSYTIYATNIPSSYGATGLPAGLTLDPATGIISGDITASTGVYIVGLSATNSFGTGSATLTLTVKVEPTDPPIINSSLFAYGQLDKAFTYKITAANNPTSFNATGLPAGLSVDTLTGVISGTPTVFGATAVPISASNAYGTSTRSLQLTLEAVPVITSPPSASATIGVPFRYQITATNSPTGFTADGLPVGLVVDQQTGVISGAPQLLKGNAQDTGLFSVSLFATNGTRGGYGNLQLNVQEGTTSCVASLKPTSQSFSPAGGSGNFVVGVGAECAWTAVSNVSWLTVTTGASGQGGGAVSYTVAANPAGGVRKGVISVGGASFTVTQKNR